VIDGDTYEFDVDLGMHVHAHEHIRLRGYSARESNTVAGKAATQAAVEILMRVGASIIIETYKDVQTFQRYVADVYVDGTPLWQLLGDHVTPGSSMGAPRE
jgi:hypothetical protein